MLSEHPKVYITVRTIFSALFSSQSSILLIKSFKNGWNNNFVSSSDIQLTTVTTDSYETQIIFFRPNDRYASLL